MNVFDKSLLFEMSYALMRRFAFVEVGLPDEAAFHEIIERAADQADSEGYVSVEELFPAFQDADFNPDQIDFALRRAREGSLADPLPPEGDPRAVRITSIGAYAHQRLADEFQYLDAVVIDTPIADSALRGELAVVHSVRARLQRAELFLKYLQSAWDASGLASMGLFDWPAAAAAGQAEMAHIADRL